MEKHNGWTNYATWRVNLEIFDGNYDSFVDYDVDMLKDYVEEILDTGNDLATSYALAFVSQVNYYEILEHINEYNNEVA